jgi:hypothetical protein
MQQFEYRVVPAPRKAEKARGLKTTAERFAHALSQTMNDMAREGWEYLRADTLPCEERAGLTGKTTTYQNVLVFRRALARMSDAPAPSLVLSEPVAPRLGSARDLDALPPTEAARAPALGPAREEPAKG